MKNPEWFIQVLEKLILRYNTDNRFVVMFNTRTSPFSLFEVE